MDKKELLNEINSAFIMISRIPVTGDSVDAMAVARAKLRKVYEAIEQMEEEQK
jgi:hypothetical protein